METEKTKQGFATSISLLTAEATMEEGYPKAVSANLLSMGDLKKLIYGKDSDNYMRVLVSVLDPLVDVNISNLCLYDLDKLVLHLRINSVSAESKYLLAVPEKTTPIPIQIDLTQLKLNPFPATFVEPRKVSDDLSLILPRVSTQIQYEDVGLAEKLTDLDSYVRFIQQGNTLSDKIKIFDGLTPVQVNEIHAFAKEANQYGIENTFMKKYKYTDDEGEEKEGSREIEISFRQDFFLPDFA